ncbi:MAG TPA: acetylxylan esterase [Armatimonadota bacterium]|nr:acetylxylan esterase [Armatimonadota bacterium]
MTRTIHTRDLNMHYGFVGYSTLDEWEAWATYLRRHILVSTGLWPEPEKCDLEPEIFGRIERDGYSVEKVYFQSYPGFYVCGNLYRPLGKEGPFPGIISPHGHWSVGRLANEERGSVPGRGISLARQGNVVFTYDMVGYRDSSQIEHRKVEQRRELWGQCNLALQLWNSIRSIDFLQSLPEVDDDRIACTGASGGGTQTFMVMGIDERVKVAAPVNMVSAHMQGGCVCENAPNLRVDTFNTEIAALQAPRPLMLVSASGDWTKNTLVEEGPDVETIYDLHGAMEKVEYVQVDAEHNYNLESREHVYGFMALMTRNPCASSPSKWRRMRTCSYSRIARCPATPLARRRCSSRSTRPRRSNSTPTPPRIRRG